YVAYDAGALGCALFFSSRRRHTRSKRDWSSDVCSSDLKLPCCCFYTTTRSQRKAPRALRMVNGWAMLYIVRCYTYNTPVVFVHRSEERRVGKECRWVWWLGNVETEYTRRERRGDKDFVN